MADSVKDPTTGVITVRLGEIRPLLENMCERLGVERSEFIRQAVHEKMQWSQMIDARALCAGAAWRFRHLVGSATRAGLVGEPLGQRVNEAVEEFEQQFRAELDSLYEEKFPDAARIDREDVEAYRKWKRGGEKGPGPQFRESPDGGHRWRALVETCQSDSFPDLQRATAYIRRAGGQDEPYAPRGYWEPPEGKKRDTR
jgi:hypothetical protein